MLDVGLYKATADMGEISNHIEDEGAHYISEFIKKNKSVKLLDIIHNNISNIGLSEICEAIKQNNTLLHVNYSQYGLNINQIIVQQINKKLDENKTQISDEDKKNARYIKHSKKILLIDSIYRNNM
jgi:hypothetical protein